MSILCRPAFRNGCPQLRVTCRPCLEMAMETKRARGNCPKDATVSKRRFRRRPLPKTKQRSSPMSSISDCWRCMWLNSHPWIGKPGIFRIRQRVQPGFGWENPLICLIGLFQTRGVDLFYLERTQFTRKPRFRIERPKLIFLSLGKLFREPIPHSGPLFRKAVVEGGRIRLHFDHVYGGLQTSDDEPLEGLAK